MSELKSITRLLVDEGWKPLNQSTRILGNTPKEPGIYCFVSHNILTRDNKAVYIGKSINLNTRLKPWHKVERVFKSHECILFCYILLTPDYDVKEIEHIKRFRPPINIQHNPAITREIIYHYG